MVASGQLLAERYLLSSRLAVGGMGEVWEANDTRLDRAVAVKILKAELSGDAEFLHRFRTEARTTASLNHPGIAGVHDYGETVEPGADAEPESDATSNVAYLVMELVRGEPLAGILATHGRLTGERTLDILEQAGNALQAAHESGLVHRDVKPGNILVTATGQVKITDFGVAKAADAAPVTRSGVVMGTAHYIAPEQALGHDAEPASDVYSLAVCGYECLAGYRPFRSENAVTVAMMHIREVPPPLPADVVGGLRALIEATLIKDPRQRYGNGGEFANALAAVRNGLPLPVPAANYVPMQAPAQNPAMTPAGPPSHPAMPPVAPPNAQASDPSGPTGPVPQQAPQHVQQQVQQQAQQQAPQPAPHHPVAQPPAAQQPPPVPLPPPTGGHRRNITLWVVLSVLVVLLVVAGALLLPRLLDNPAGESSGLGSGIVPATGTSSAVRSSNVPGDGAPGTLIDTAPPKQGERHVRHGPGAGSPGHDR